MGTDHERIRAYYSTFDEWGRTETAAGAVEFARALALIRAYVPPAARILDLGGGPGRYALALARAGHRVVLADLSPALLAIARRQLAGADVCGHIESIDEANAQDLGRYSDASFDAVVAFGPFYHLTLAAERLRAGREILRVIRPGGVALIAFIPRAGGIAGLIERAAAHPEQVSASTLREAAVTGVFRNASGSGFPEGYYAFPAEMETLLGEVGLAVIDVVSLRSVCYGLEKELASLPAPLRAEAERISDSLGRLPEVIASCGPAVIVIRRDALP